MLLTDPLPTHPLKSAVPLPSPNQLLRKIIIKNKKRHHTRREKKRVPAATGHTAASPTETASNSLSSGNGNSPSRQQPTTGSVVGSLPSQISDAAQTIGTPERRTLRNLANTATNSSEESNTQDGSSGGNQTSVVTTLVQQQQPSSNTQMTANVQQTTTNNSTAQQPPPPPQSIKTPGSSTIDNSNLNSCDLDDESDTSIEEDDGPSSDAGNASIILSSTASNQQAVVGSTNLATSAAISTTTTPQAIVAQPKTAHIKESEAAEELSALVNYIEAAPFHSFEYAESKFAFRIRSQLPV